MKKLTLLTAVLVCLSFVACKKDRVCECTVGGTVMKATLNDATKRQAKDACTSKTYDNGNGSSTKVECELK